MAEPRRKLTLAGAALSAGVMLASAGPSRAQDPAPVDPAPVLGQWITHDRDGVFQIDRCGSTLCGRLVGMRYEGSVPQDVFKRPQCNMMLLRGFVPGDDPGNWAGTIYDPDNGNTYRATIASPRADVLTLRGYLLMPLFGETQTWTRYRGGAIGAACKLP